MDDKANRPSFALGRIVATRGALMACLHHNVEALTLIARHAARDWGDLPDDDRRENDHALRVGNRLLSAYVLSKEILIWVITEADRSATTLLLPEEY